MAAFTAVPAFFQMVRAISSRYSMSNARDSPGGGGVRYASKMEQVKFIPVYSWKNSFGGISPGGERSPEGDTASSRFDISPITAEPSK